MPQFAKLASAADQDVAAHLPTDYDLPLKMEIPTDVPEARSHHFIVDEKAVEAVRMLFVSSLFSFYDFVLRLPIRM
jgi:hypothetical protein